MSTPLPLLVKPLRIKRLTLTDFRAFPGPAPVHFDLDGRNMLIYGENGSGKSSIFHALNNFFSLGRTRPLNTFKNVFSDEPDTGCAVSIEFDDGALAASWNLHIVPSGFEPSFQSNAFQTTAPSERHPAAISGGNDSRVIQGALRKACLDYRALLDTNYRHGDSVVNLFEIAAERLLADFSVPVGGVSRTVGELWRAIPTVLLPSKYDKTGAIKRVLQACADFNGGFNQALAALEPLVGTLLAELIGADVAVKILPFVGLTYNAAHYQRDRRIGGCELHIDVTYRSHPLERPQYFLNEARLSALALAIYLAGRLACTPTATPAALKLLVMDDVLIGLDHSNRLPLLDLLQKRFADWQVVLMTHDKTWFDLARAHLPETTWGCIEIYEGDGAAKAPMPIVRQTDNRPAPALLQKAEDLLKLGYVEAAANYTRQAFEYGARAACELKKIEMPFRRDPKSIKSQGFLDKLKAWKAKGKITQADWDAAIHRLELFKDVVMNPYSHPSAPNIPKQEVTDAIAAVNSFLELVRKN